MHKCRWWDSCFQFHSMFRTLRTKHYRLGGCAGKQELGMSKHDPALGLLLSACYFCRLAKPLERLKQKHAGFNQRMVSNMCPDWAMAQRHSACIPTYGHTMYAASGSLPSLVDYAVPC